MKTIDYERYIFRITVQERDESFESFVERLRIQVRKCRFPDIEMQLKDQIIEKCNSKELRQRAFEHEMSLKQLIFTGKTLETAERNYQRDSRDFREPREQFRRQMSREDRPQCSRCGFNDHEQSFHNCPAKRGLCEVCKKPGHFARMCKSHRSVNRNRSRSPIDRNRKTPMRDNQAVVTKQEKPSPPREVAQNILSDPQKTQNEPVATNNHDPRQHVDSKSNESCYQKGSASDLSYHQKVAKSDLCYQQNTAANGHGYQRSTSNDHGLQRMLSKDASFDKSNEASNKTAVKSNCTVADEHKPPTLVIKDITSLAKEQQKLASPTSPMAPIYMHINPE